MSLGFGGGSGGRCGQAGRGAASRPDQGLVECGLGQPEVAQGFDGGVDAGDLQPRVGEQFEHADEHAVVAQQVLVQDALTQRHDLVTVVAGDVPGRAVGAVGFTHFAAGVDGHVGGLVQGLAVDGLGLGHARAAAVEQRQLEADLPAALGRRFV